MNGDFKMVKQKRNAQEATCEQEPLTIESATLENQRVDLEEIRKMEGVNGYILRNPCSATVNMNDPSTVTNLAILSYSISEASRKISELFSLGNINRIVVEGKNKKILQLALDQAWASIFMEKTVEIAAIQEKLEQS
jgi:predicted regulator of Ras-like GTPase activity (Roadblock/LC7/MglB family)